MSTWCSKHVEAWNKLIVKQKFCAPSCLITKINIRRFTVSKTSKNGSEYRSCHGNVAKTRLKGLIYVWTNGKYFQHVFWTVICVSSLVVKCGAICLGYCFNWITVGLLTEGLSWIKKARCLISISSHHIAQQHPEKVSFPP